jgi:hypothetical protein
MEAGAVGSIRIGGVLGAVGTSGRSTEVGIVPPPPVQSPPGAGVVGMQTVALPKALLAPATPLEE